MKMFIKRLESLFYSGSHSAVLSQTIDSKSEALKITEVLFTIGSLSFLGRVEEATVLFETYNDLLSISERTACRFFLAIGYTRQSEYKTARLYLIQNLKNSKLNNDTLSKFYTYQGMAFYKYFSGRFNLSNKYATRALKVATGTQFLYGKVLASDIVGHSNVRLGKISYGIRKLEQASSIAGLLSDGGLRKTILVSILTYKLRFGYKIPQDFKYKNFLKRLKIEDTYSKSMLLLELSRHYALKGNLTEARNILDSACEQIYQTNNRRHEVSLNIRYAEIYYQTKEYYLCLNLIKNCQRLIDPAVDKHLEIEALGIEQKVISKIGLNSRNREIRERIEILSCSSGDYVNSRILSRQNKKVNSLARSQEDRIGDLIDACYSDRDAAIEKIYKTGYLSLLRKLFDLPENKIVIYFDIIPGTVTVFSKSLVHVVDKGLSPTLKKICALLSQGEVTKQQLVEDVWQYQYDPLRHDSLVYSSISKIRRLLERDSMTVIENSNLGYNLADDVLIRIERSHITQKNVSSATPDDQTPKNTIILKDDLNYRQLQILKMVNKNPYTDLQWCLKNFDVAPVTVSRDLSLLTKLGYIKRLGRGRATKYISI